MPDPHKSQQISSVAELLGTYLEHSLKRQEQFKAPPKKTVQVTDEAGNVFFKNVSSRELDEGVLARPAQAKPDNLGDTENKFNLISKYLNEGDRTIAGGMIADAKEDNIFSDVDNRVINDFLDSRAKDIGVEKEVDVLDETPIDKLDNDILTHREKIEDLKKYEAVGVEPAVKAEKRSRFGIDRLAKDIKAQPARYFKLVPNKDEVDGEPVKVYITKQEHDSLKKKQENAEELINIRERKIDFRERQKDKLIGRGFKATVKKERKPLGDILK